MMRKRSRQSTQAELDITSFMNLMIILVPVLLLSMVFAHITVVNIQLPELDKALSNVDDPQDSQLELVIEQEALALFFPAGVPLKRFVNRQDQYDYSALGDYLKQVKRSFQSKQIDKKDIVLKPEENIDYQTLISVIDQVRSYKAVVAADVVEAELFPQISFGDAH